MTISDVAEANGVSVKTLSRVLNREPTVQSSTRERVLEVMYQINYTPFEADRGMQTMKTGLIGVMTGATKFSADEAQWSRSSCCQSAQRNSDRDRSI